MINRVIKFRAWDKGYKKMYNPEDIENIDNDVDPDTDYLIKLNENVFGPKRYRPLSSVVLMQFTGLLDKNNKEIYEGDIIVGYTCNNGERVVAAVEFCPTRGFYIYDNREIMDRIMYDGGITLGNEVEVIGNIFENKELITEK